MKIDEVVNARALPAVRALFEEYAASLDVDLSFQGFAAELANLPGRYVPPRGGLWLALDGDEAAGCIALRPFDDARCEVKRLYVRPAFRGTGLGRRLADAALARAVDAGYERACLDTLPSMDGAIALYRSLGFTTIDPYYDNPVPGVLFLELRLVPG